MHDAPQSAGFPGFLLNLTNSDRIRTPRRGIAAGAGPAGTETKGPLMNLVNVAAGRVIPRSTTYGLLAAVFVVGMMVCAPALAQDAGVSSAVAVTPVTPEAPPVNFSLLGLFLSADWIVKIVMLGLLGASVWCWAIIVDKSMLYGRANRQMNCVRAGVLVRPVAGGSLPADAGAAADGAGRDLRCRDERVEAQPRAERGVVPRRAGAPREGARRGDRARERRARKAAAVFSRRSARRRPSLASLARYGAS